MLSRHLKALFQINHVRTLYQTGVLAIMKCCMYKSLLLYNGGPEELFPFQVRKELLEHS